MIVDLPRIEGPRIVALITSELAFSDSPAYMLERRARALLQMVETTREAWLYDAEREEGVEVALALRALMDDMQAISV